MKALLVRIGVDQAYGNWNAPVDPTSGVFVYVPIPERIGTSFHPELERRYDELVPSLHHFCFKCGLDLEADLHFPKQLLAHAMHLDPDFSTLTYGDQGDRRGARIAEMHEDDLLVFYAGFRPIRPCNHKLVYALLGLYVISEIVPIAEVSRNHWGDNAHTRKSKWGVTDIVARAKPRISGRFDRCVSIGEWRSGAYRVRQDVLEEWGGLSVKDGFIQRSAVPPSFSDPPRFRKWFERQGIKLLARNN